jgi:hypothetical protein
VNQSDEQEIRSFLAEMTRECERHDAVMNSIFMRLRYLLGDVKVLRVLTPTPSLTGRKSKCVQIGKARAKKKQDSAREGTGGDE